jgi:hypothetical protein
MTYFLDPLVDVCFVACSHLVNEIEIVAAVEAESKVEEFPPGTMVIVCDPDPTQARKVARRVTGFRSHVFVGDLSSADGRKRAEEFADELRSGLRLGRELR